MAPGHEVDLVSLDREKVCPDFTNASISALYGAWPLTIHQMTNVQTARRHLLKEQIER